MSRAIHCDLAECDAWQFVSYKRAGVEFADDWAHIFEGATPIGDYCCGAHAWQDLARRFEPPTEVAL